MIYLLDQAAKAVFPKGADMQRSFSLAAVTCVTGLVLFASAPAEAATSLVRVSGGTRFDGCTIGQTPTSTLYPGAEVEPQVANSRFLPWRVVGVYQQDRWSDGGARGLVSAWSN